MDAQGLVELTEAVGRHDAQRRPHSFDWDGQYLLGLRLRVSGEACLRSGQQDLEG